MESCGPAPSAEKVIDNTGEINSENLNEERFRLLEQDPDQQSTVPPVPKVCFRPTPNAMQLVQESLDRIEQSEAAQKNVEPRRSSMTEINWQDQSVIQEAADKEHNVLSDIYNCADTLGVGRVIREGYQELQVVFHSIDGVAVHQAAANAAARAERCISCVVKKSWKVISHCELPDWLRDNEFLWHGHRPPLDSFKKCFVSMFTIHTETGNIWTHFIGLILFVAALIYVFVRPKFNIGLYYPRGWQEGLVFGAFFAGAIVCMLFSWLFHTVSSHSCKVHDLFAKLDYTGISCLIVGSNVPFLYYAFFCRRASQLSYLISLVLVGSVGIVFSLWDKFSKPKYRWLRAAVFLFLGCLAFFPSLHSVIIFGLNQSLAQSALGWVVLMGFLYISGALLYAFRVPERFCPGHCNIMVQSHQIFHVLVVVAAFIHLHAICLMANYRYSMGTNCTLAAGASSNSSVML